MAYGLKEIELMISNLPKSGIIPSLDAVYLPKRRHIQANVGSIPFETRPRRIINALIQHVLPKSETISVFVDGVAKQYPKDKDVRRLIAHFLV